MDIYVQQAMEELRIFFDGLKSGKAIVDNDMVMVPYTESEDNDRYIVYEFNNPNYLRDDNFSIQHMKLSSSGKNKILNFLQDKYGIRLNDESNEEMYEGKFTQNDINYIVLESVKRILKEDILKYYIVDDGGVYNVFSSDMFDAQGRYIENKNYTIDDFDIIKTTNSEEQAWKIVDKLNREAEEGSYDFAPSRGYYNENKIKTSVSGTDLKRMIKECFEEVIKEESMLFDNEQPTENQYDNVPDNVLETWNGEYYEVIVPEWALNALVNGNYEGLDEEDIADVKAFERNFVKGGPCELKDGLTVGDCCVPMEGASPNFEPKNDINHKGAMCYKFALPC